VRRGPAAEFGEIGDGGVNPLGSRASFIRLNKRLSF
jgi:hypothetical protein